MPAAKTLVVVPAHNESSALPGVIRELKLDPGLDILVVDDASSDNSRDVAYAEGAIVLPLTIKLGAWGAMQTGFRFAYKHGYQTVITMDGDGQHHSREIAQLMEVSRAAPEVDVVIGSCLQRGSLLRRIAWRYFRCLTGLGVQDLTSGFRVYNRRALAELLHEEASLLEYQDIGVLLLLKNRGLKVLEVDVSMSPRGDGKSRVYSSWFRVAYYMIVTTILSVSKYKKASPPDITG